MHSFPAVRKPQPITKRPKFLQQPMSNCYKGYMVKNNNISYLYSFRNPISKPGSRVPWTYLLYAVSDFYSFLINTFS